MILPNSWNFNVWIDCKREGSVWIKHEIGRSDNGKEILFGEICGIIRKVG